MARENPQSLLMQTITDWYETVLSLSDEWPCSFSFQEVFTLDRNKYDERVSAEINQGHNNREISQEHGSYPDVMNFDDVDAAMNSKEHALPTESLGE